MILGCVSSINSNDLSNPYINSKLLNDYSNIITKNFDSNHKNFKKKSKNNILTINTKYYIIKNTIDQNIFYGEINFLPHSREYEIL